MKLEKAIKMIKSVNFEIFVKDISDDSLICVYKLQRDDIGFISSVSICYPEALVKEIIPCSNKVNIVAYI